MNCDYCGHPAELVTGDVLYPHRPDLAHLHFHRCQPCAAYVGCHNAGHWTYINGEKVVSDGTLPLGRLANAELRQAKQRAHAAFDPIWTSPGGVTRKEAYAWLRVTLGLTAEQCHIGKFDVEQCEAVIRAVLDRDRILKKVA